MKPTFFIRRVFHVQIFMSNYIELCSTVYKGPANVTYSNFTLFTLINTLLQRV